VRPDLRSFLADPAMPVLRIAEPLSVVQEITALQHALAGRDSHPALLIERPVLPDGSISPMPVVTNLTASRELTARLIGIADHRQAASTYAKRAAAPIAPATVERPEAPVQEVVVEGGDIDLRRLPILRQHALDIGHYLTRAHVSTFDPETGIDNTAIQRCGVRGAARMTFYPYETSHNARNLRKHWAKGEACPVAIWIGHHPALSVGAQAKLGYPESHWAAAGGLTGAPIRLVPSLTHGARIMVPADAEIVIEGWIPPDRWEADGPLAEYTGYMGVQIPAPTVEVTRITRRRDAVYVDCGGGLRDHLIPDNLAMEGRLYQLVRAVAPSLVNVHVPFSGRRFHAYLQFRDPPLGEVRDGLAAALAFRRLRSAVAVDDDIDLFDDRSVLWAVATRMQWNRDLMRIDGLTYPNHDPSLPPDASTITKAGIDATLPPARGPGLPRPVAPPITVTATARAAAAAALAELDDSAWPKA